MSEPDIKLVPQELEVMTMHVFVTGASGFIGGAVVPELLAAGHRVSGIARSDRSAAALEAHGVEVRRGDLDDLDALRTGAEAADAVIHLANKHDFANPKVSDRAERDAVETFATTLMGSDRPFLFAAGVAIAPGRVVTEDDRNPQSGPDAPRGGAEALAMDYAARGLHAVSLRFAPTVHGEGDHGFIRIIADAARRRGSSAYVGDGTNAWAAVARADAGRLVALALDSAPAGSTVHVVGEEGVPTRDIATAIGAQLDVPVASISPDDAADQMGFVGRFFALDLPASSEITRQRFGWTPAGPSLLDDIAAGFYTS